MVYNIDINLIIAHRREIMFFQLCLRGLAYCFLRLCLFSFVCYRLFKSRWLVLCIHVYMIYVYEYIYIYIYIYTQTRHNAQLPIPLLLLSFIFFLTARWAHPARGLTRRVHTSCSSWRGHLEISSGKVRVQHGTRPRVPLVPIPGSYPISGKVCVQRGSRSRVLHHAVMQIKQKTRIVNLKASSKLCLKQEMEASSEERAVAGSPSP